MNPYPSKLLLFGEYTVIYGSQALAIPFDRFGGAWQYDGDAMDLDGLASYLEDLQKQGQLLAAIDLVAFQTALRKGLYFKSDIPTGYGLGSSGALCAAVYQVYGNEQSTADWGKLKQQLAQIESYFHGSSSGIDPLVCYLNQPILVSENQAVSKVELNTSKDKLNTLFLIDTQKSRKTEPLVDLFKSRCLDQYYADRLQSELIPLTDNAIHAFRQADGTALFDLMHLISHFQFKYFDAMILDGFKGLWLDSLASDLYKLKLCGAGGGGMILGFTRDYEQTKVVLKEYSLMEVLRF